jgi:hypothetical protein
LVETLPVEELVKVHGWVMRIVAVEGVCTLWFGVVVLKGVEVMIGPVGGLTEG